MSPIASPAASPTRLSTVPNPLSSSSVAAPPFMESPLSARIRALRSSGSLLFFVPSRAIHLSKAFEQKNSQHSVITNMKRRVGTIPKRVEHQSLINAPILPPRPPPKALSSPMRDPMYARRSEVTNAPLTERIQMRSTEPLHLSATSLAEKTNSMSIRA